MSHVSGVNLKGWLNVHKLLNIVSQWIVDSVKCKIHVDCIQSPVNCVTTSTSTSFGEGSILARSMFGPLQGICDNNTAAVIWWRGGWWCGDVIGQLPEPVQRGQWSAQPGWREGSAKAYQFLHSCALVPWVNHSVSAESAMLSPHPRTTYHLTSSVQAEVEVEAL